MTTEKLRSRLPIKPLVGSVAALLLCSHAFGKPETSDITWLTAPSDNNWFNSSNWSPAIVPDNSGTTAHFDQSNITNPDLGDSFIQLGGITFNSGANAYTINVNDSSVQFWNTGIVNQSKVTQNIVVGGGSDGGGTIEFFNSATAGQNTTITLLGSVTGGEGSVVHFWDTSSAGGATIVAMGNGGTLSGNVGGGAGIYFLDDSTGGTAAIKVYGNGFLDISNHNPGSVMIGSLEGNGNVFVGSNNLAVGSNDRSTIFSGSIQDGGEGGGTGGSLTKIGTGTLTLTGINTYTGNTIINGGALIVDGVIASPFTFVNPGSTLGGHGIIGGSVINNGLVSPGNSPGTLTINGNYAQTSIGGLLIQVATHHTFDHLIIGGAASLSGTLYVQPLDIPKLKKGEKFQFLTAGGGVSGTFGEVVQDKSTLMRFKVKYGSNDVTLRTYVAPFTSIGGLTPNQQSVASALNQLTNDKNASKLINFLATQPIGNLSGDFDKLAAEEFTSIFTIGTSFDNVQSLTLQSYLDSLRSGTGYSAGGLALNGFSVNYAGPISFRTGAAGPNGDDGKSSKEVQQVAPAENRWGAFLTGTGQWVGVSDDFNARGYDIATGGFTLGVDYKVCSHCAVGIMAGYVGTSVDAADGGRVLVNGGKLGLYATMFQNRQPAPPASTGLSKDSSKESKQVVVPAEVDPGWYADIAVVGGYSSYDLHRSGLEGTARGDTDGGDLNVLFGAGYDFKRGNFTFGPTASFNYTYVGVGSFTESGSLAPLRIDSQGQESIRTAFGMKASYDWKVGGLLIKPELRAAWQHEYGDSAYALNSSFADGNAGNFTVWGPRIGRDSFLLGAGFAIQLSDRLSTYFYYDGELGRTRYDSHSVTGGVRLAF
ncbi:outer membrane autotransporter barrel domain protein [Chthoniobacter flavus Ellin428]|uniref:Outer membrane autotransporter barrel domain protein n=1 Tax=Chthoniobacter flavus Ellin428 TaxID=497964 RepID=B4D0X9_9BACT|nr:autotransporter outer membrane beta-barrel domain-containing protein [Chthoniobacter flavus]EDY19991.1 outer membrane autotransporter barrel domain protein [Chthoniobacter flavus Ellin428]TCO91741.1 outer membrane autotransporter protein [Chthoniobacter flavus]